MGPETLRIEQAPRGGKGRSFAVTLLAYIEAHGLMGRKAVDEVRPVWIAYLGSEQEARAFTANFRAGRRARVGRGERLRVRKSDPFCWQARKVPGGLLVVGFLPRLFALEPQLPEDAGFVFAPPAWWVAEQAETLCMSFGEEAEEAARAALFAAYLDRRTEIPIVHDLAFHLALYRRALEAPWMLASRERAFGSGPFYARGLPLVGLEEARLCAPSRAGLRSFLTEQTVHFYEEEIRRGKTRIAAGGRILPYPEAPATQLCFDFEMAV